MKRNGAVNTLEPIEFRKVHAQVPSETNRLNKEMTATFNITLIFWFLAFIWFGDGSILLFEFPADSFLSNALFHNGEWAIRIFSQLIFVFFMRVQMILKIPKRKVSFITTLKTARKSSITSLRLR